MSGPLRPAAACGERETILRLSALRSRDALDGAGETLLNRHVVACPACFADAAAVDPSLLFVRLSASAAPGEDASRGAPRFARGARDEAAEAETLAADVLAAIRCRAAEGAGRTHRTAGGFRPWLRAAAVVFLASGLAAVFALRKPDVSVATPPRAAVAGEMAMAGPIVESLESPGARVYQFAAASPSEPTVVFIANPGADI